MKKVVYIAHPISGAVRNNVLKVQEIYRTLSLENEVIPFAPYIASLNALDDNNKAERAMGIEHNRQWFERKVFDELWVYGHSKGVSDEIELATKMGIPWVWKGDYENPF